MALCDPATQSVAFFDDESAGGRGDVGNQEGLSGGNDREESGDSR